MIIALVLKNSNTIHTIGDSIAEIRKAVELGEPIECWWYMSSGKKYKETFVFPDDGDAVSHYVSESDVPFEEM